MGRDFPHLCRPTVGPTLPPVQLIPVFPGSKERPGRDADPSPHSSVWSRKSRTIPLLPLWPYGLYRASVPVQGCTLPLPYQHTKYQTCVNRMFIQVISRFSLSNLTGTTKIDQSEEDAVSSRCQALSSGGV